MTCMHEHLNTHVCAQGFNVLSPFSNHSPRVLKTKQKMKTLCKNTPLRNVYKAAIVADSLCFGEAP